MKLKHDFKVDIATAPSRLSKKWRNREWLWSEIADRCSRTRRTDESVREYLKMTREEQGNIKDVGGFVGGYLQGGRRGTANVLYRTLVTLDIDYGRESVWDDFTMSFGCAAMIYSTHKHTPEKPRLRLVMPANRHITPEEYEPVCRYWTSRIGIEQFDHTTYQRARLFYWPSTSRDGEYVFECQDGPAFDVDAVLAAYRDPFDAAEWPVSSREGEAMAMEVRKAGDPMEKPGLIGAFCRAYGICNAIETYLPEVYERTAQEGRYTYRAGHTAGGLVCWEDKYAYSHHETDPAGGYVRNAFDLVRIHLYGHQDEGVQVTDVTRLSSYTKMLELAAKDRAVRALLTKEKMSEAEQDFSEVDRELPADKDDDEVWMSDIERDKRGNAKPTPKSLKTIMLNDPAFKTVKYDLFSQRDIIIDENSPFVGTHSPDEVDDTSLSLMCGYLTEVYGITISVSALVEKMLKLTARTRACHVVRDYITKEKWDGVPRVDTLLVDYLGAEDTPAVREVTRKWMAGAVGRAIDTDPETGEGIKFDYCLVLQGEQGTGKSTFAETLANKWRGSISFADAKKEQYETLQRSWIVEVPEFKGMREADMDAVKDLISSRSDNFRAAYARQWCKNPRHSVMVGSTNNECFLKDATGNRRFWVVRVTGGRGVSNWAGELKGCVGQIWAEAYEIYVSGEKLMLSDETERQMREYADTFNEEMGDPLRGYLDEWLSIPLPVDWETYEPKKRMDYYKYYDPLSAVGTVPREQVAIHEIVTTCPYPGLSKYTSRRIAGILKSLGWEKGERRRADLYRASDGRNARVTYYIRPQEGGHVGGHVWKNRDL